MLRITLTIIPHGDEEEAREIGHINVGNILTDDNNVADYKCWDDKGTATSYVYDHQRGKRNGQWRLARKAIMAVIKMRERRK